MIQKASIFKYFKERNVIFIFFLFNATYKGLHTKPAHLLWDEVRKKTLKSSRLSWENDLYFLWLLKLFERHCGVWGTSVLALVAEAQGTGRRGRVCPGLVTAGSRCPHCTHHRAQLSPQLRWGQNPLGVPLGNVLKTVQNHLWWCKTTSSEKWEGKVWETALLPRWDEEEPQRLEQRFPCTHSGDHDHASSPAASGGPCVGEEDEEWVTGISCYKLATNLTSPTNLCCSVGASKRVGNEGVNLRRTRGEGVLGFVLVSHHTNLLQSTIN